MYGMGGVVIEARDKSADEGPMLGIYCPNCDWELLQRVIAMDDLDTAIRRHFESEHMGRTIGHSDSDGT